MPDLAAYTELDSSVGTLTGGTNLFRGPVRAENASGTIPAQAVFCLKSAGPAAEALISAAEELEWPQVEIRVRSGADDFGGGQVLADACYAALHHVTIAGWLDVEAQQSAPIYLGDTEKGLHEWVVNVQFHRKA